MSRQRYLVTRLCYHKTQRLNKLGMFTMRGNEWSDDELDDDADDDDSENSLYVCARRLRNKVRTYVVCFLVCVCVCTVCAGENAYTNMPLHK
jgi:hypothetical protein